MNFLIDKDRPFESKIILIVSFLAVLRILFELVEDVFAKSVWQEIGTELLVLFIVSLLMYRLYKNKQKTTISIYFFIIIPAILTINFIQFNGVIGNNEYNIYAVVVFFTLVLDKKLSGIFFLYFVLLIILAMYSLYTQNILFKTFFLKNYSQSTAFIFTAFFILFMLLSAKIFINLEEKKMNEMMTAYDAKIALSKKHNIRLLQDQLVLKKAQSKLEFESNRRKDSLEEKNLAIQKYINDNTSAIQKPLKELLKEIDDFKDEESEYRSFLVVSAEELKIISDKIKEALQFDENISRIKIRDEKSI